ncbi:hypothetical protein [Kangiella spongicola]|uniref:Uncharacterized protein n=1 Tax=Kangiella spongicola TaxID=796379 RepID=A0A318D4G0_9GAMM|nr:hypothetical protein [Kangiella spongicola]PXF62755.1 hypothetical protein DL796_10545 [Kangiella spongicola]
MSIKAVRILLLLTLLSVVGQLVALNPHCDMSMTASQPMKAMDTAKHEGMDHSAHIKVVITDTMNEMPCCDISTGCDMATCVVPMMHASVEQFEYSNTSNQVNLYLATFHSLTPESLYKPPILS